VGGKGLPRQTKKTAVSDEQGKTHPQQDPPPCMIRVDKEGAWFHKGAPIVHRGLLELFYASIRLDQQGRYIIEFHDQTCFLDVEDTPFVVQRATFVRRKDGQGKDRFMLHLIDETEEALDPATLTVGAGHVLYCKIRQGHFTARFSRPSYYQLAQHIQQDPESHKFFISLNGTRYFIDDQRLDPMS
jgi:hypothetical protein